MKKILVLSLVFMMAVKVFGSGESEYVVGKWYTDGKESVVEIFKKGDKFYGKIIWIKDEFNTDGSVKKDTKNPDESLRNQTIKGLEILKGFTFDDDEWSDGTIYDPKSGKTYSCIMKKKSGKKLSIRGYVGVSLFGKTTVWTRK